MADLPIETSVDESQPVPRKVGKPRLDLILALCAIFISAVSLAVAIQNSFIQRETLAGSTWPFVQRNMSTLGKDGYITIGIANDGVGPAKIRSIEIAVDAKPVRTTGELLAACCGYRPDAAEGRRPLNGLVTSLADNTVLRAGEANDMIRLPASVDTADLHRRLSRALPRISFRGCYCSVLDRCWVSDLASVSAQPVDSCPAPTHPFDPIKR